MWALAAAPGDLHGKSAAEALDESIQYLDRGVLLTEEGPVAEFRPQLGKLARKGQGEEREKDEHPNRVPELEQFQVLSVPNLADG